MKVSILTSDLGYNGIGVLSRRIFKALRLANVSVDLYEINYCSTNMFTDLSPILKRPFVPRICFRFRLPDNLLKVTYFINSKLLIMPHYDLYHYTSATYVSQLKRRSVVTIHDAIQFVFPEFFSNNVRTQLQIFYEAAKRDALFIHTVSNYSKAEISHSLGIPEEMIEVVYPSVETFAKTSRQCPKYNTILHIGSGWKKNFKFVLKILKEVLKLRRGIRLVQVGYSEGELKEVLRLGLYRNVLLKKEISTDELQNLLAYSDILIAPHLHEGFGLAVAEAMSQGIPVIVSSRGALPEVVNHAGIVIDSFEECEWVETILRILEDKSLYSTLSRKGLERAKKICDIRHAGVKLLKLYVEYMQ